MAVFVRPYATLRDLQNNPGRRDLIGRVIRLWETCRRCRRSQIQSLNFLLLDELGVLIKGTINHRLIPYFRNMLREGCIYHISNFEIYENNERLKLTDHKYAIQFTHLSIVSEVLDDAPVIGRTKFRIHDYESLVRLANRNLCLPDVVGRITFVSGSNLRNIQTTHKIMAKIVFEDGTQVRLSVWDRVASDFRAFLSATQRTKCVVIITAVNPKLFAGELYLNTSPATRFYLIDDLEGGNFQSQHLDENQNSLLEELELDKVNSPAMTISQMLSFLDTEEPQEKEFYCSARIVKILTRKGWYYISCAKCYNRIKTVENKLICTYCEDSHFIAVVRFRIEIIVDDETDQARFVICDKDVRKLTNMLAEDLVSYEDSSSLTLQQHLLPPCLLELIGRNYTFKLRLTQFDFKAKEKTFSVADIVNGPIRSLTEVAPKQKIKQVNEAEAVKQQLHEVEKSKDSEVARRRSSRSKRKHP